MPQSGKVIMIALFCCFCKESIPCTASTWFTNWLMINWINKPVDKVFVICFGYKGEAGHWNILTGIHSILKLILFWPDWKLHTFRISSYLYCLIRNTYNLRGKSPASDNADFFPHYRMRHLRCGLNSGGSSMRTSLPPEWLSSTSTITTS